MSLQAAKVLWLWQLWHSPSSLQLAWEMALTEAYTSECEAKLKTASEALGAPGERRPAGPVLGSWHRRCAQAKLL